MVPCDAGGLTFVVCDALVPGVSPAADALVAESDDVTNRVVASWPASLTSLVVVVASSTVDDVVSTAPPEA